jgi:hydrogenase maturation protein HypF
MDPMVTCSDQREALIGLEIRAKGVVQGVGFRPYIYRLALAHDLSGWVRNENGSVLITVEGLETNINAFLEQIILQQPCLAMISTLEQKRVNLKDYDKFSIDLSKGSADHNLGIPADVAVCRECLEELCTPADRHHLYPFTNCTNCGPRFTIIEDTPYDREKTSMNHFLPCPDCDEEYHDPANRRFHAQPIACPACGPHLRVLDQSGRVVIAEKQWLKFFHDQIALGKIFAVKGLGGFHLCCAAAEATVNELRSRKNRSAKPFALLCRDLVTASKYCHISESEAAWLVSPQAPVVLLSATEDCTLPPNINPNLTTLGLMLPYTPLHSLMMSGPHDVLIFTSANAGGLPLVKDDDEALKNLQGIADYYLTHNRHIVQRCDDSVVSLKSGDLQIHRRSRGFTPSPLTLGFSCDATVLGSGAEMKNTFCIIKGNEAVLSQHQGEIETVESEKVYLENLNQMLNLMNTGIDVVGFDLHPAYNISALARQITANRYYGVYHHHAHFASCLAENNYKNKAIGVILDGTGYGDDGMIWGFEILSGDFLSYNREYHQSYLPQPGGELATGAPWRVAVSYLRQSMGSEGLVAADELFGNRFMKELPIVAWQLENNINTILSSSCGRLFDAVASMLNICHLNKYDGQAAIELSELLASEIPSAGGDHYPFSITDDEIILLDMFPEIWRDIKAGRNKKHIARCFHDTLALAISEAVLKVANRTGLDTIALSGGTWLNPYLLRKTSQLLKNINLKVLLQHKVPPNDGGLSLGQAAIASWRLINDVPGYTNAPVGVKQ